MVYKRFLLNLGLKSTLETFVVKMQISLNFTRLS